MYLVTKYGSTQYLLKKDEDTEFPNVTYWYLAKLQADKWYSYKTLNPSILDYNQLNSIEISDEEATLILFGAE